MKRRLTAAAALLLAAAAIAAPPRVARAQDLPVGDEVILRANEALLAKDGARLVALRQAATAQGHPLAQWVEYWELGLRLAELQQGEFERFAERWRGTYVEDRARNDWLLELGRRRDWANLAAEYPRFRMNDDREVTCYALLARHLAGQDVRSAGRAAPPRTDRGAAGRA